MRKWEKEMKEVIRNMSDNIQIPESLKPESVKDMLEGQGVTPKKGVRRMSERYFWSMAAVAATCIGIVGITYFYLSQNVDEKYVRNKGNGNTNMVVQEVRTEDFSDSSIRYARNYEEINERFKQGYERGYETVKSATNETQPIKSATWHSDRMKSNVNSNFSKTNTQVEGVEEGDLSKTDGTYIYMASNQKKARVWIVRDPGQSIEKVAVIECGEDGIATIEDLYVTEKRLVVVGSNLSEEGETLACLYNIEDKAKPKLLAKRAQDGAYIESRLKDGYLYLFSRKYTASPYHCRGYEESKPEYKRESDLIPVVDGDILSPSEIYLADAKRAGSFLVMTSVSLESGNRIQKKTLTVDNQFCYVSNQYMYFTIDRYETKKKQSTWRAKTNIIRFYYHKGNFGYDRETTVYGQLKDQFAIDEQDEMVRLVLTNYGNKKMSNSLLILDKDLKQIGSVSGLARGERIYSARFLGDIAYFVTYRETDPLFSVDLSDPKNPKVLGALKIPGFSEYLHPYGENRLLGIGCQENKKTGDRKLKLSMFDISDPGDVKEVNKKVLSFDDSEALNNHRCVLIDPNKNVIGFPVYKEDMTDQAGYLVYSYDEKNGFQPKLEVADRNKSNGKYRGLYIGENLYITNDQHGIKRYHMSDLKETASFSMRKK